MRRSKLGLIFALALGLIAAVAVWKYTQQLQTQVQVAAQQAAEKAKEEQVPVLVAAHDIPAHATIGPDDLQVIQISKPAKVASALVKPDDAIGKIAQYPISSGEQILPDKFVDKLVTGLSFVVPPGKRAISIRVSEDVDTGGLLQPGDHVDVIGSFDKQIAGKDEALIFIQNAEVLAVAQSFEGEPPDTAQAATDQVANKVVSASPSGTPGPAAVSTPVRPKSQPDAKTVTLAVSPEEAQRLALAQDKGHLTLALRPPQDNSLVDTAETDMNSIRGPVEKPAIEIVSVSFSPTTAKAGDTLKVQVVVKNTSDKPLKSEDPKPEFTYVQGQTFFSQNYPSQDGAYRIGVSFDGHPSAPFPYRWGLGGDLAPGASTTVVGYIKLTYDIKPTNFWVGAIREPSTVIQDNVGTTLISVMPANVAVISVDAANVRSGPDIASSVVDKLNYGTEVPILGQEKDWFKVKLPDGREGYVAAGWIIAPR